MYEEKFVIFIDCLGWKEKVESSVNDPGKQKEINNFLSIWEVARKINTQESRGKISYFSDCVTLSFTPSEISIQQIIDNLALIQIGAGLMGFYLRGAVTKGLIRHDSSMIFGPALNRAYSLESKTAIYPRIVLDDEHLQTSGFRKTKTDNNGVTYISSFSASTIEEIASLSATNSNYETGRQLTQKYLAIPNSDIPKNTEIIKPGLRSMALLALNKIPSSDKKSKEKIEWIIKEMNSIK